MDENTKRLLELVRANKMEAIEDSVGQSKSLAPRNLLSPFLTDTVQLVTTVEREREAGLVSASSSGGGEMRGTEVDEGEEGKHRKKAKKGSKKKHKKEKKYKKHKKEKKERKHKKDKKERKDKKKKRSASPSSSSSSSSSDSDSDCESSSDDDVPRNCITGKKIKMYRKQTAQDKANEIERAALRHFMNAR